MTATGGFTLMRRRFTLPSPSRLRPSPSRLSLSVLCVLLVQSVLTSAVFTDTDNAGGNAVSTSSCFQAKVAGVQSGTLTNSANGTQTATISAVTTSRAFLHFSTSSNSNRPVGSTVSGRILNSTTLEFARSTNESSPATITIRWNVVEYACGVTVQRGVASQSTTTTNVAISAVPSTSQAFLTWSKTGDQTETDWASGHQTSGELTSTTNVQFRTRATPAGGAWYAGWSYRKPITLTAGQISGTHTNFPVLISITDANLASGAQADADDIVFTDGDGVTKLDHEIESYTSATGTLVAWVRKPTLSSSSNTMYLYYGNAAATNQQNADGTWDSTYLGVWHLNQNPAGSAPQVTDSSGNGANGTTNGSMAAGARVTAKVGQGLDFDGSNDYVSIPALGTTYDNVTVEVWFKADTLTNGNAGLVSRNAWAAGTVHFKAHNVPELTAAPNGQSGATSPITTATWYQGAYTFSKNGNVVLYKNGASADTTTAGSTAWPATGVEFGHEHTDYTAGARFFDGILDEARISNVNRSSQWLATEYSNQSNPGGFATLGSQESGGAATPHAIWWQVVSFDKAADIKVQRGTISITGTGTSAAVTLSSAVDLGRAFALVDLASSGTGADIGALRARLTGTTTLTIDRSATGTPDDIEDIVWQVVELKEGSRVRSGSASFAGGTATVDTTVDPVDTTRTTGFGSVQFGGGQAMGRTAYVSDDVPGVATATVALTSATNVRLVRANTAGAADIAWFAVEWGGEAWWNSAYAFRQPLSVTAGSTAMPTGYSVSVTVDHAALVAANQALASGNDVRVGYFDGATWTELDRILDPSSGWNSATTKLWFKTRAAVAANASDANYYLYYANPSAGSPPASQSNVYLFTDGIESGTTANWTQQAGGSGGWYNVAWTKRKPITLTAGQISGTNTDFPVLISVADANLASGAQADGDDILFTDGDGTTKLDHQIESWTPGSGTLVAWVRKPTLAAASNTMYVYYGNAAATSQQNASGVWSSDYKGVWHLNQAPSDSLNDDLPDATSNANQATSRGSMASANPVTGKVGGALTFDGSDDYLNTSNTLTNPQVFTTQAWVKTSSASGKVIFGLESSKTGTSSTNYDRTLFLDTTGKAGVTVYDGTNDKPVRAGSLANNAWHFVVGTYDTGTDTLIIYVDGVAQASVVATTAENYTGYLRIGSYRTDISNTSAGYLPGQLDEVRFSTLAHSAGWISTEYNNQNNPGGFHTLGSQETPAAGTDFTAATDQAHSGTYSLKAAPGTSVTRWLVANGLDYADVRVDAWWRLSTTTNVTVSQGVRAGGGGTVNQYEGTLNTTPRWTTTKDVNGTVSTVYTAPADATCPTANTWAKVSVEISGTGWRTFCNDTQVAPAAGFSTTGGELSSGSVGFRVANIPAAQNWWIDDVVVRRFVYPEPTLTLGTADRP